MENKEEIQQTVSGAIDTLVDIKIPESLKKYSDKYNRPMKDLTERYAAIYKTLEGKEETIRTRMAITKIANQIRREEGVTPYTTDYKGIVLGATGPEDAIENTRQISFHIFNKDPERAVREGYTNDDGVVLDRRDRVMGRPNPKRGMPLEGEDWRRTIIGLATKADESDYKFFTLNCYGEEAVNIKVLSNVPVFFRALEKMSGNERMTLTTSSVTRFTPIDEEINIEEKLKEKNLIVPLKGIEEWYEYNKQDKRAILVTEGSVYRMRREPNERNRKSLILSEYEDPEAIQPFSVRENVSMDGFDEDARVLVFGKPRYIRNRLWIDTLGVYPLKDYLIPLVEAPKTEEPVE